GSWGASRPGSHSPTGGAPTSGSSAATACRSRCASSTSTPAGSSARARHRCRYRWRAAPAAGGSSTGGRRRPRRLAAQQHEAAPVGLLAPAAERHLLLQPRDLALELGARLGLRLVLVPERLLLRQVVAVVERNDEPVSHQVRLLRGHPGEHLLVERRPVRLGDPLLELLLERLLARALVR